LVLAGEGPETTALQALARSLGIGDHVAFVGRTDRARTGALFAGCCVFVLPSRHEPQGIVILEAMAAAKPVVATRVGGVPEIVVDNETGQLVSAESPDELARGIMAVLESPDRAAMAERGRLRAAEFDWPLVADRYRDLYEQCAQSRASAGAAR
jgi:glycosyltransferase involved in cell wall biosynthesis